MCDFDYPVRGFAQQGWQCPICGRVYSPTTPMCYYCGGDHTTTASDSLQITYNNGKIPINPCDTSNADWMKTQSTVVSLNG